MAMAQLRVTTCAPNDIAITLHHKLCRSPPSLEQIITRRGYGNILEIARQRENGRPPVLVAGTPADGGLFFLGK